MSSRRTSLALVLALLAGIVGARPEPTALAKRAATFENLSAASHTRRSARRLDAQARDHRRAPNHQSVALLVRAVTLLAPPLVGFVDPVAPHETHHARSGPIAVARAPPQAA